MNSEIVLNSIRIEELINCLCRHLDLQKCTIDILDNLKRHLNDNEDTLSGIEFKEKNILDKNGNLDASKGFVKIKEGGNGLIYKIDDNIVKITKIEDSFTDTDIKFFRYSFLSEAILGCILYCSSSCFPRLRINPFIKTTGLYVATCNVPDIRTGCTKICKKHILVLEPLEQNFNEFCKRNHLERILIKVVELMNILDYLQKTIQFTHNDLHSGNVMLTKKDEIKIIDYGAVKCDLSNCGYGISDICIKNFAYGDIISDKVEDSMMDIDVKFCDKHLLKNYSQDVRLFLSSIYQYLGTEIQVYIREKTNDYDRHIIPFFHNFYGSVIKNSDPNFYPETISRVIRSKYPRLEYTDVFKN